MSHEIIYEDLEIDYSGYLKEPLTFAKNVEEKAEELRTVLKSDDSVTSWISHLPKVDPILEASFIRQAKTKLDEFYYWVADNAPTQSVPAVAKLLRELAQSVEYIQRDRAFLALSEKLGTQDKSVVHEQYCSLREKFNEWRKAAIALKIIQQDDVAPMVPMSGNYGSTVGLVHYVFRFAEEEDTYRNHRAVARRLELDKESTLMDVIEWIEANPDCNVTVTKVRN